MDLGLKGKTSLIVGGTQGIGFGAAKVFAQEGARVIVASRQEKNIQKAVSELQKTVAGAEVEGICLDISQLDSIAENLSKLLKQVPIDIVVNNSGGPPAGKILNLEVEDWDKGYQLLLRGVVAISKAVLPGMQERKWGRIATVTSSAAREIIPQLPVSATFRAGLSAWTKSLAKEVGRDGVLVNNVLPGPVNTARLQELKDKSPDFFQSMANNTAVGRIGETDEVGRVIAFLCSEANTFMTGTDILVDGGITKGL